MVYAAHGSTENAARAFDEVLSLEPSNPIATLNLGLMYAESHPGKARELFQAAYAHGDLQAAYNLGVLYETGSGGKRCLKEAHKLYMAAHLGGVTEASCNLGRMYLEGEGVKKDPAKAFVFFQQSGEPVAAFNLGLMYGDGKGVERDLGKAQKYLKVAANAGVADAAEALEVLKPLLQKLAAQKSRASLNQTADPAVCHANLKANAAVGSSLPPAPPCLQCGDPGNPSNVELVETRSIAPEIVSANIGECTRTDVPLSIALKRNHQTTPNKLSLAPRSAILWSMNLLAMLSLMSPQQRALPLCWTNCRI